MRLLCRSLAARAPALVGNVWTFLTVILVTIVWVATGPIFDWSGNWLLIPATITSVGAFVLLFGLQYTQNRDTRAIQLKLDEVIRSLDQARTDLVRLERLPDETIDEIEREFERLKNND
jgi:low affinity Fe/Cu permease